MTTHHQPAPSTSSSHRTRRTRLVNLNMGIAQTHRIATQLVGIQLSGANLLALAVSAASIVAGTVTLVAQKYPYNWPLLLSAGVIGLGLALLIEGLTLGSLIRIRVANRTLRQIEEKIESEMSAVLANLKIPDPNQPGSRRAMRQYRQTVRLVQQDSRRKCRRAARLQRRQRRFSLPFAIMGATASAAAGGLFYHTILAGLGQIESLALAVLFPLVVTGTFVASEIYKDAQEDAIKEGFGGGALTETAIREETKLQSALAVHQKVVTYLEKPEAEQAIEAGAKSMLHDILAELRETSRRFRPSTTVAEDRDDTTRQPPLALLEQAKAFNRGERSERHDNQDDTTPVSLPASPPEPPPEENSADARGKNAQNNAVQHDRTASPVLQQDIRHVARQDDSAADDSADSLLRSQSRPDERQREVPSKPKPPRSSPQTTNEHDIATTRLLAYLADHQHAKQAEIAEALGVTVRTVQRKLAALRDQEAG